VTFSKMDALIQGIPGWPAFLETVHDILHPLFGNLCSTTSTIDYYLWGKANPEAPTE